VVSFRCKNKNKKTTMAKILGIDLGTNSAGWSIIDNTTNEILDTGVRIFPEGVNKDASGSESPKNLERRNARGVRKNNFRYKLRRNKLKSILAELEKNPIWIDEKNGLFVKSVTCKTGLSNLWDASRGYVKPGNNHHIAIYENEKGELNEVCITLWEAFERKQQGDNIIAQLIQNLGT
jgi:CRISPR/Cas system Type II protein with McrA/HNH and RuvC-like nuclease domain